MTSMQQIERELFPVKTDAELHAGDTVRVHVRIAEPGKGKKKKSGARIQVFEGTIIALRRGGHRSTFTVRKISYGVGVERIFPVDSPIVEKIEVTKRHHVRRAKLYYLRELRGKAARLKPRR